MDDLTDYIYLDHNATTPICDAAVEEINKHLKGLHGNPSSSHLLGREAKKSLINYRELVSKCFQAPIHGVIYMSGGTEVNNTIIKIAVDDWWKKFNSIPYVITSKMEHPSILKLLEHLQNQQKISIYWMNICPEIGIVQHQSIPGEILMQTCLVTIMQANNETGVIQPVNKIFGDLKSKISKFYTNGYLPFFHSDASQAIGRIQIFEIFDLITVTGHKFGGPCIAALITKNEEFLKLLQKNPFIFGGGQEGGYRSGTENLPMIAGLSAAIKWATDNISDFQKVSQIRDYFEAQLIEKFGAKSFYQNSIRLPNTASICFPTYSGLAAEILQRCDKIFAASTGAACHSDGITISPCLLACGRSIEEASKTIRFSLGRDNTQEQIDKVIEAILKAFKKNY